MFINIILFFEIKGFYHLIFFKYKVNSMGLKQRDDTLADS